jgi:hypothetical protein
MLPALELTTIHTVGKIACECGVNVDRVVCVVHAPNCVRSGRLIGMRLYRAPAMNRAPNGPTRNRTKRQGGQP